MTNIVRIGNAHGFWGDRLQAAAELLAQDPDLDYLTLDFLAEVSMSIMASQQQRDSASGFAKDFLDVVHSLTPYWRSGGRCRVVTNAGGLNPRGCADRCAEILARGGYMDRKIAIVEGDNVVHLLRADAASGQHHAHWRNLDTGQPIDDVSENVLTANAYLGAAAIAKALELGADLVITGRVADPSLTVGPCLHHFDWRMDDYDRIAGATIAGHLIECGTQVTGGISTDWLNVPSIDRIGFPIVEVASDGDCVVAKGRGSGGAVTAATVKEQLLYEIGDPNAYLSPDVTVSFLALEVTQESTDRVRVSGARGKDPPSTYKVSATYHRGYWSAGQLTLVGREANAKAQRAAEAVLSTLRRDGIELEHRHVELLGDSATQVVLRIAVADAHREPVEAFTRSIMPLITAGPPGTTGYAEGRPRVHPWIGFWPCLIDRHRVTTQVEIVQGQASTEERLDSPPIQPSPVKVEHRRADADQRKTGHEPTGTLLDIATARSGDKGIHANIGIIARHPDDEARMAQLLTVQRVADHFGVSQSCVDRYELPNLGALNFVIRGVLSNSLQTDAQGKTLAQRLLAMPLDETSFQSKRRQP